MKYSLTPYLVAAAVASYASAAEIRLQNSTDGSNKLTLDGLWGKIDYMSIVIETYEIDTVPIAYVNAFLDDTSDDDVMVITLEGRSDWIYDHSAFKFPAHLDEAGGDEYGLVSGVRSYPSQGNPLPLGSATQLIEKIGLYPYAQSGTTLVSFELGARAPSVYGPAPDYPFFPVAPANSPPNIPGYLYIGDASSTNPAFEIDYIPEPMTLSMATFGAMIVLRSRRTLRVGL